MNGVPHRDPAPVIAVAEGVASYGICGRIPVIIILPQVRRHRGKKSPRAISSESVDTRGVALRESVSRVKMRLL